MGIGVMRFVCFVFISICSAAAMCEGAQAHHCYIRSPDVSFGIVDPLRIEGTKALTSIKLECYAVTTPTHYCVILQGAEPERLLTTKTGGKEWRIPFNFYHDGDIFGGEGDFGKAVYGVADRPGGVRQNPTISLSAKLGKAGGVDLARGIYRGRFQTILYGAYGRDTLNEDEKEKLCKGIKPARVTYWTERSQIFTVSAEIKKSCSVTADSIDFGKYPNLENVKDMEGRVRVKCSDPTDFKVGLGAGSNAALTGGKTRAMKCSDRALCDTNSIAYDLYQDSSHTEKWTDRWQTNEVAMGHTDDKITDLPVYGKVMTGQATPPAGIYTDTVIVTVRYSGKA